MGDEKNPRKKEEQDQLEKIRSLQEMIATAERTISSAKAMLSQVQTQEVGSQRRPTNQSDGEGRVVHGTFDGQIMVGEDGKQYPVPANYASKSKLVEGDMLKLNITSDGNFVYKQIGPTERKYLIGIVQQDERGNFTIKTDEKTFKVLLAAATYFRVEAGDEVTLVIPRDQQSTWGAIENVVRKASEVLSASSAGIDDFSSEERNSTEDERAEEEDEYRPSAIERLEKEIEEERKRLLNQKSLVDEWIPDAEALKKETKKPALVKEEE